MILDKVSLPDTTLQLRNQSGAHVVVNDDWKIRFNGRQQAELVFSRAMILKRLLLSPSTRAIHRPGAGADPRRQVSALFRFTSCNKIIDECGYRGIRRGRTD